MDNKKKVLILYHSGAGSTKTIAEVYYEKLNSYNVDISPICLQQYDYQKLNEYDFIIFAFPTYHAEPSSSMAEFINKMPALRESKRAFVFTTCGLYSGNALRNFIKKCEGKNIITCGYASYKGPATDGVLLLPVLPMFFNYEKKIGQRIKAHTDKIELILKSEDAKEILPPFSLITILNYPNKVLGKRVKHKLKIVEQDCIKCKKCINNCIRNCWEEDNDYPRFNKSNCECCFRCVHHCPQEAIILSGKTRKKPKFNTHFYNIHKKKILEQELQKRLPG